MMTYFGISKREQDAQREETEQRSADDAEDGDGSLSVEHRAHTCSVNTLSN